ncbi:hypothetical protein QQY79_18400 [Flavobacterium tructae]|uniref:hypothetical protein n=1 Tax=Flavobacterium tructae TaxID=1114873 RepID=UPI0025520DBB|nr:hypothetical protein [Flavobacterium tructae]MDL2144504.1 hypothetical protein [Flavobacterium tructae]
MNENPFGFFDLILTVLAENYYSTYSLEELTIAVHQATNKDLALKIIEQKKNEDDVMNALIFLNKEELVAIDSIYNRTIINTKGLIKIRTGGFESEYLQVKRSKQIQSFNQIATPIIATLALVVGIINLAYIIFFKTP